MFLPSVRSQLCVLGSWSWLILFLLGLLSSISAYWWHRHLSIACGRTYSVTLNIIYLPVMVNLWIGVVVLIPGDQELELGQFFIILFSNE